MSAKFYQKVALSMWAFFSTANLASLAGLLHSRAAFKIINIFLLIFLLFPRREMNHNGSSHVDAK